MLSNPSIIYRIRGGLGSPMHLQGDELPISQLHKGRQVTWFFLQYNDRLNLRCSYRTWVQLHSYTVVYWGWGFFQMQLGWRLQPFKHFKPKPGFREHLEQTFHQFGFCENWWLEPWNGTLKNDWFRKGHTCEPWLPGNLFFQGCPFHRPTENPKHIRQWNEIHRQQGGPPG